MKRLFLTIWLLSLPLSAMERVQGWCEKGNVPVVAPSTTGGGTSLRYFQQSYPRCNVSVFVTGSGGSYAVIYSDNSGTILANPFTADVNGYWGFYVANGTYDISISGGGLSVPVTFSAVMAFDISGYSPPSPSFSQITAGTNTSALVMGGTGSFSTSGSAVINFATGGHTTPWLVGVAASKPATCTAGEGYFASDATAGQNIYLCSSTNTWTQVQGSGGGGGPFLPLAGGTMTGTLISNNSGIGAITMAYPSNLKAQISPTSGQSATCTNISCPDTTLVDYFGFEGNFFRIKGGGDYFDWTRWGPSTSALALHTINFNDSSFNTIIHVDETAGYPLSRTQFNGGVDLGYCNDPASGATCTGISPDVGIYRNTTNVLEVTVGGPSGGVAANLARTIGDSFLSFSTGTNVAFQANNGTMKVLGNGLTYSNNFSVSSSGVINWDNGSGTAEPVFRYNGTATLGHIQFSDDGGMNWTNIASSASPYWTLTSTNLYPSSTTYKVFVGASADDGSAAKFQVAGTVHSTGSITSAATVTGLNLAVSGTSSINMNGSASFRYNGTAGSGNVQFSDDNGGSWANIASLAAGHWTLTSSRLYPDMTSYEVLVGRTTDDGSGAPLQIASTTGSGACGGNHCAINADGAFIANPVSGIALQVNAGVFGVNYQGIVTTAQYYNLPDVAPVNLVGTIAWNGTGHIRWNRTSLQMEFSNDGTTWAPFVNGASAWTLTGNDLYPSNSANKVLVGRTTEDGSGAQLEVLGDIRSVGNIDASLSVVSENTGTNVAFQGGGGTFKVLGNGLTGAANFNLGAGGTYQFNGQAGFQCIGGIGGPPCTLQWSTDGSSWNNFTSSNTWTLNTSGAHTLRPADPTALVLVGRSTFDTSSAWLEVGLDGATSPRSANFHGELDVQAISTNFAINVNSGQFAVNGLGAVSASGPLAIGGQGSSFGTSSSGSTTVWVNGSLIAGTSSPADAATTGLISAGGTQSGMKLYDRNAGFGTSAGQQFTSYVSNLVWRLSTPTNGDLFTVNGTAQAISGDTLPAGTSNTAGYVQINGVRSFRRSTGVLQWFDGTNWNNFSTGGGGGVTSVTGSGAGISVSPTTGAVIVQNTGVTSVTGTVNQVNVSAASGAVNFSLPQAICPTCTNVTFGGLLVNTTNDGSGYFLQVQGGIESKGTGFNITSQGTGTNAITASAGGIQANQGFYVGSSNVVTSTGSIYSYDRFASHNGGNGYNTTPWTPGATAAGRLFIYDVNGTFVGSIPIY